MKALKSVLAAASFFAVSQSATAQFVVIDPASITQQIATVAEQVKQNLAWTEQYRQMYSQITNQIDQIQKAKATLENMTGSRLLGLVRNELATNATVPNDVKGMLAALEIPDQLNQAIKSLATNGLIATAKRGTQIQGLMGDINSTTDAKGVAELNARISAEIANVQNDTNRILLSQAEAKARERDLVELEVTFNDSTTGRAQKALQWRGF